MVIWKREAVQTSDTWYYRGWIIAVLYRDLIISDHHAHICFSDTSVVSLTKGVVSSSSVIGTCSGRHRSAYRAQLTCSAANRKDVGSIPAEAAVSFRWRRNAIRARVQRDVSACCQHDVSTCLKGNRGVRDTPLSIYVHACVCMCARICRHTKRKHLRGAEGWTPGITHWSRATVYCVKNATFRNDLRRVCAGWYFIYKLRE